MHSVEMPTKQKKGSVADDEDEDGGGGGGEWNFFWILLKMFVSSIRE